MRPQSVDLAAIVSNRLNALEALSLNDLAVLPQVSEEELLFEGGKHVLCTWHDVLETGEHRIVVQLFERGLISVKCKCVKGFVVNAANERRTLSPTDLATFN